MASGIILIVAGILIALYPPLLSIIVATLLILAGVAVLSIAHYNKKLRKHYDNPAVNLFFRF
jgi:positive regulator of sigma E activity